MNDARCTCNENWQCPLCWKERQSMLRDGHELAVKGAVVIWLRNLTGHREPKR